MSAGLPEVVGRRRRRTAPATVTVVLATGDQHTLDAGTPLARVMGSLAALLAHWDDRHAYSAEAGLPKDLRDLSGKGRA